MSNKVYDCIIIGGGPAGLTAAIYLARYRRKIALYDSLSSRAQKIPLSHNYPGFPEGISGNDFLKKLRQQLSFYKVPVINNKVISLQQLKTERFLITTSNETCQSRNIILATGVKDIELELEDINKEVDRGNIRYCPVCDGYEAINKIVAVIGNGKSALMEALFLRNYTSHVTLLSSTNDWSKKELREITQAKLTVIAEEILEIKRSAKQLIIYFADKSFTRYECIYSALGCSENNKLAKDLKANLEKDRLIVDEHQQTSVNGLFAAGDIVSGLNQICVATSQAAIAATTIHKLLPKNY